jgi:hypothetical protein
MTIGTTVLPRLVALLLAASGFVHAELYVSGYRAIPVVGPAFLLQASASFAVALLLLLGGPVLFRWLAAALAVGALVGFALSRTLGVAGFVERGWQPAPQALLSVLAETALLLVLTVQLVNATLRDT